MIYRTDYRDYRRQGMAAGRAFGMVLRSLVVDSIGFLVRALIAAGLLLAGYAATDWIDDRFEKDRELSSLRQYNEALRAVVATCLATSSGRPILIGSEWFLCGAAPTGEHI